MLISLDAEDADECLSDASRLCFSFRKRFAGPREVNVPRATRAISIQELLTSQRVRGFREIASNRRNIISKRIELGRVSSSVDSYVSSRLREFIEWGQSR